jgi:hypothetical protein
MARTKGDTKDKEEGSASATTLKLDGIPLDLLQQLGQAGVLQRGSASMATGLTTTALIRKGDVLSADGEHGLGGESAYRWLIDSGATHTMTPYRPDYVTLKRGSLSITVANGETTMA